MLTERQRETVVELIAKIVNATEGRTWQDKRGYVVTMFREQDQEATLEELLSWFSAGTDATKYSPPAATE